MLKNFFAVVFNILFPNHCIICKNIIQSDKINYICLDCINKLSYIHRDDYIRCNRCGRIIDTKDSTCICSYENIYFDECKSMLYYDDKTSNLIHKMKFSHRYLICKDFAVMLSFYYKDYINKFDAVIVTIGEDIMTSILTSLILKELNVKNIIARYSDERHKAILSKIGITHLVSPEESMGIHIAEQLEVGDSLLLYDLTEYHSIVEFPVHAGLAGKNLKELDLRKKYKINVVAIKKETTSILGEKKIIVDCTPDPDESMVEGDILVIAGHDKDIEKLNRKLSE